MIDCWQSFAVAAVVVHTRNEKKETILQRVHGLFVKGPNEMASRRNHAIIFGASQLSAASTQSPSRPMSSFSKPETTSC